jgi:ribose transport system permease protein
VTSETAATPRSQWLTAAAWRRVLRDQPLIPLTLLLLALVVVLQIVNPGIVTAAWAGVIVRQAVPLAILAGCQTLAMLTGGIDLSVGAVASMAAFVMATLVNSQGPLVAILAGLGIALLSGVITGVGIGVFKVHPLIMTLGMSLVVLGFVAVYQLAMVLSGIVIPDPIVWLGSETTFGFIPNSVFLFVPLAILIVGGLRRSGYGRLLFAIGDNAVASRLAGVRIWQVLVVLYTLSALLAAIAGFLVAGLNKTASPALVESAVLPSVAAAVIGGTSILGGRGGFAGTIVGALILTLLNTLLTTLNMPEAMRQVLFGAIIVVVAAAYTRVTGEA